jgi:hypothetical protein
MKLNIVEAVKFINDAGLSLTFPQSNQLDPPSLWFSFYPRTQMRWEWDANGDEKVSKLWIFREELSRSGRVAYTKWFKNKATFLSLETFTHLLNVMNTDLEERALLGELSKGAFKILNLLNENSPQSTKDIKKKLNLQGRYFESEYNKSMNELWKKLLIVGWGEKNDGAFPSLNIASSKLFFEKAWKEAEKNKRLESHNFLIKKFKNSPSVFNHYTRLAKLSLTPGL